VIEQGVERREKIEGGFLPLGGRGGKYSLDSTWIQSGGDKVTSPDALTKKWSGTQLPGWLLVTARGVSGALEVGERGRARFAFLHEAQAF